MTGITFPFDPANLSALKSWLAAQDNSTGALRSIDIGEILIGPATLLELPNVLKRAGTEPGAHIQLVIDETEMWRDDVELKPFVRALLSVAGYSESAMHLEEDEYGVVHADFESVEDAVWGMEQGDLGRPARAIIGLGSGTVTDIAKHAAYLYNQKHPDRRVAYFCIPTANSVTAYAANMSVLLKDGVKRTIPSCYPDAIVCDLRVLADAPKEMTLAGLGDCCARFVAYGDWYLASALGLVDYYSEVPLALLDNLDGILLEHAASIGERSLEGEAVVMRALLLAGMAQSVVNMSAPVSGTEHVTAHVLDMIAEHYERGLALHGAQVGVATLTAATLYERFLDQFDPATVSIDACYAADDAALQRYVRHIFRPIDPSGAMAKECWNDYSKKLALWRQQRPRFEEFCANWHETFRPKLASLVRGPEVVRRILSEAGAPLTIEALEPPISQKEYDFAVRNGHFIRQRFVLGDLLYFLGWE